MKQQTGQSVEEAAQAVQEAFAKSLDVLTNAEKDMLFQLHLKLYEQDKQMIIIPNDESNSFDVSYVRHKRHKKIPLEEDNVLEAGKTPDIEEKNPYEDLKVRSIPDTPIPVTP